METQKAANALERVQSDTQEKVVDSASAQKALQGLSTSSNVTAPKIKIREEDIRVLMTELEIEKAEAEKALISTSGDFKEALFNLIMN